MQNRVPVALGGYLYVQAGSIHRRFHLFGKVSRCWNSEDGRVHPLRSTHCEPHPVDLDGQQGSFILPILVRPKRGSRCFQQVCRRVGTSLAAKS